MSHLTIYPSTLSGQIRVPPSKSHSQRALLFAMRAEGRCQISNLLSSPDTEAMIRAITSLGAKVSATNGSLLVEKGDDKEKQRSFLINGGNSGQVARFITAMASLSCDTYTITADHSLQELRSIQPLVSALQMLGGKASYLRRFGYLPLTIQGPIHPGTCRLDGSDSQPVSALLMATAFLDGPSTIEVDRPGESPWIDLTLHWLKRLGCHVEHHCYTHYYVPGKLSYPPFSYTIPGDFSSAAFPIGAALVTQSSLKIAGLDRYDIQGDKVVIDLLQQMGGKIQWEGDLLRVYPSQLHGIKIDIDRCIDALPLLAVLGCFAKGTTHLYNGAIARKKESDRIATMANQLKQMGAKLQELPDGLLIEESPLQGGSLSAHRDHRVALALTIAAFGAEGPSTLEGIEWVSKSYPDFIPSFQQIGAKFVLDPVRV